jgi:malate dehydrogenase (oxaloacetate-decarboxylating)(NADP+)
MVRLITNRAKIEPKRIVFAEADHLDVLKRHKLHMKKEFVIPFYWKQRNHFRTKRRVGFYAELEIIDPKIKKKKMRDEISLQLFIGNRKRKGISL